VSRVRLDSDVAPSRRSGLLPLLLMLIGTLVLIGCVLPADNQQSNTEADLRSIVASDRQQINALQDQVNRLNDQIAEMKHNGEAGDESPDAKKRIAELEHEVEQLKTGQPAPTPMGGDNTTASGSLPIGPGGGPSGPPGFGSPGGMVAPTPGGGPPGGPVAMGGPPPSGSASNAPPNDNADADGDDNAGDDNTDSAPEVASAGPPSNVAPPPAAAPPGPPMVAGSPSWRGLINPELASAQSSRDPAAKVYRAGLLAMKGGKYANAIGVFQGLQRKYPKSPLSEPAEYFSANALYELGKYDQSILQFNDLVMRFPRGRFAGASLLSEAQAFMKMGDRIDARLTLQKLLSDHPDAPEATTARAMMNSLASG
jgi:tol-pal system protein YbgF